MSKKVLVAMSGGVDSSVAALLLKEAGYEVTGMTMCLGVKPGGYEKKTTCCSLDSIEDAQQVCIKVGINHYVMDFSKELKTMVIDKFITEYFRGRTPNPCIDCNRYLKFDTLFKKARILGFDYLATGHYAKIEKKGEEYFLKKSKDKLKDQSYFLYPIKTDAMESLLFPLGDLTKEDVREIAWKSGLSVAQKPESQDLCFVNRKNYQSFLLENCPEIKAGPIIDISGNILGDHKGIIFYTIGQRSGLGISHSIPLYVVSKDVDRNLIVVGEKKDLKAKGLIASDLNLLARALPQAAYAKIRYKSEEAKCLIDAYGDEIKVIFDQSQEAITPGQSVVFYDGDRVLGGAVINEVLL